MKSKLFVAFLLIIIVLPVGFVAFRELRHRRADARNLLHKKHSWNPKPFTYSIKVRDTSVKGFILLAPYELKRWDTGQLVIMDLTGRIHVQQPVNGAVYDFRQWKIEGNVYYSYIVNDPKAYHVRGTKVTCGHVVLLNGALQKIKDIHLLPHNDITVDQKQDLDLHDFIMLSENHYITIASYEKSVNNIPISLKPNPAVKVTAVIIQEIKNDSLIWQWDATQYAELYAASIEHNHFGDTTKTQDYLHINAICLDPADSNLICSFRGADMLIKVNRKNGKIMWKLGGKLSDFPLTAAQKFERQHSIIYSADNNGFLLLDNGDSVTRHISRITEFNIDEKHRKITSFASYAIPDTFCQYLGNVNKHGNQYFVSGGTGKYVLMYDPKTGHKSFLMHTSLPTYRAYFVENIYGLEQPEQRPAE